MVSGNKAQLVERILKHAEGSVARTFDEDIEDDDENMPYSSHDDTSSDSEEESTEYEGGSSGDDYVERSFQVLFIDGCRHTRSSVKVKRNVGRIGGWEGGGGLKVISPLDGGGQEVILTLIQGRCNFILRPTLLILEPPLQIIIAQSLSFDCFTLSQCISYKVTTH